jgi:peroxiredoxin
MSLTTLVATISAGLPTALCGDDEAAPVADFLLDSAAGERISLYAEQPQRRLTVLAFTAVGCPIAKLLAPRLGRYEQQYRERGVRFLGIDPNVQDSSEEILQFAQDAGVGFPILRDPAQVVTDRLGVTRTTEAFVLDEEFGIVYRGAVDDQYSVGAQRPVPLNDYLIDALESALAGETISTEKTDAPGCLVGRVKQDPKEADVTFFRDVAPILWSHCVECHRPGQIGPMSFLDAEEAAGWAPQIAEVVAEGRMPPWHADPRHGRFKNLRRLSETEKRALDLWAASGARLGDPGHAPPRPQFPDSEWLIGQPDLVVELPQEQQIPAEGVVPYRYVTVDPGIAQDVWVQRIEVKPGNRAVTHHVMAFLVPPGMAARDALADPEAALGGLHFAGDVPGGRPTMLPDGWGKFLPKGAKFLFQLHYTPNGKAATDRTRMALGFSRVPVTHEVKARAIVNLGLNIAPYDPAATFTRSEIFTQEARITGFMPHMHLRGKSFRFELERANGEKSILLDVPRYDFNWQHTYLPAEPIPVGPGDTLTITAVYDNSKDNPFNPDPSRRVRWGDQTFEEMMVGYLGLERTVAAREPGGEPE